jgi:predicted Ser/Thr protein kinase
MTTDPLSVPVPPSTTHVNAPSTVRSHQILEEEKAWTDIATKVLGADAELVHVSRSMADSRVYRSGARAARIRSRKTPLPQGEIELDEQARFLRRAGVDAEYSSRGSWHVMTMPWLDGNPLNSAAAGLSFAKRVRLARGVVRELARLHRAGLAHGDLHPDNIVVRADGVSLLDFDRAVEGKGMRLWWEELRSRKTPEPSHPLWRMLVGLLFPSVRDARARLQSLVSRNPRTTPADAASNGAPFGAEDDIALLRRAWHSAQASNSEGSAAYYALTYKGVHFRGDRAWAMRWEPIRRGVDFRNKRVVELGCNMGLLSSFAMIHGAKAAIGADYDPRVVESAKLVARALGSGAEFFRIDLVTDRAWEEQLGTGDIVTALSVMHWLPPTAQERLLRYLGRYQEVLYEGHDPREVEMNMLKKAGFSDVRILATTDRDRVLFHGRR